MCTTYPRISAIFAAGSRALCRCTLLFCSLFQFPLGKQSFQYVSGERPGSDTYKGSLFSPSLFTHHSPSMVNGDSENKIRRVSLIAEIHFNLKQQWQGRECLTLIHRNLKTLMLQQLHFKYLFVRNFGTSLQPTSNFFSVDVSTSCTCLTHLRVTDRCVCVCVRLSECDFNRLSLSSWGVQMKNSIPSVRK